MGRTRCLLVDDLKLTRGGLKRILESQHDFEVIAEADDASQALELSLRHKPELVLMDIVMKGLSPFAVARRLRNLKPAPRVVFVTMHEEESYLRRAVMAKAHGYILKDVDPGLLVGGLRQVMRGGRFFSSELLEITLRRMENTTLSNEVVTKLTNREREITKLLVEGNSVKEIAVMLELSMKTVEAHKFNLMRKLDMHNKVELVHYAIREQLVPCPRQGLCSLRLMKEPGDGLLQQAIEAAEASLEAKTELVAAD